MLNNRLVATLLTGAAVAALSTGARAQEASSSDDTDRKDQIVVTASSRQELLNVLSPGVVSVIYPDDTKGEQKSVPDLLDQVPGVYVRRVAGTGQYTTASIRGSAPSQVNIYIDGVPFNTSSETAADLSTLPINNIERIEVYRGTVPARFSGAPLGGAINLVTKIPKSISGTASLGVRSLGGRQATVSIDAPLFGGGLLLGADLDHSDGNFKYPYIAQRELNAIDYGNAGYNGTNVSDGPGHYYSDPLQGGDGTTQYAPYSQLPVNRRRLNNSFLKENFLVKWRNDHFTAKYAYTYLDRYMPNPLLGVYDPVDIPSDAFPLSNVNEVNGGVSNSNKRRRQKQRQHDAALGWQGKIGGVDLSANFNFMDQDRAYRNLDLRSTSGIGSLWADYHTTRYGAALNASYTLDSDWPVSQLFEFHAEHSYEKMRYDADSLIDSVGVRRTDYYTDFARHRTNFQLQDTITIHPLGDLEITPIGRAEKLTGPVLGTLPNLLNITANTSGSYDWNWTWAVSAKKKVGKDWLLFASYGTYTRYPSFYEIYGDGVYVQAGTDSLGRVAPLQREYGNNLDAGFGWNGTLVGDLNGSFRATYFRRKAFDAITFFNAPLGARYINSGTTLTQGGEFEGRLAWGSRADLQFGLTVQEGHYVKGTYYLYPAIAAAERVDGKLKTLQAPPVVANARLNLHFLDGALTTYGEIKYTGRNTISQSRYGSAYETPLTTVDLGAHLTLRHGIAISAGVNDVFNRGPNQKIKGSTANKGEYQFYKCNLADMIAADDYSCYYDPASLATTSYAWDQNAYFPQQGRTFYFTVSKSFGASDGKRSGTATLGGAPNREWGGFYVGGNVGLGWAARNSDEMLVFDTRQNGQYAGQIDGALTPDPNGNITRGDVTYSGNAFHSGFDGSGAALGSTRADGIRRDRHSSASYGIRAGYDAQLGSWVFGAVGEWTHYDLTDSVSGYATNGVYSTREPLPPSSYAFTRHLKSVASLRARVGYSWAGTLGYLTGGAALGNIDHSFATTDTVNAFSESNSGKSRWGYQYGGGIERRIAGPFTIGVEYLRTSLGDGDYTVTASAAGDPPVLNGFQACTIAGSASCTPTNIRRIKSRYEINTLRMTVGYRF